MAVEKLSRAIDVLVPKITYFIDSIFGFFLWLTNIHLLLGVLPAILIGTLVIYYGLRVMLWLLPIFAVQEFREDSWINVVFSLVAWFIALGIVGLVNNENSSTKEKTDQVEKVNTNS